MTVADLLQKVIIPLLAAFFGATLAFRYQYRIELKREKRIVLQNLMIYRNIGAHELDWINSMNAIEIVFHRDQKVRELYRKFLAQTLPDVFHQGLHVETYVDLVYEMARCSGYKHLTKHEIRDCYNPIALNQHYPARNVESGPSSSSSELHTQKNGA